MIRVLFFARLADLAKTREADFPCDAEIGMRALLAQIVERFPALKDALARPELVFLAVNQEQANLETVIHDGDEVALMPPFSGG